VFAEQLTVFGGGNHLWNYDEPFTSRAIEGGLEVNTSLRIRGGWNVSSRVANGFVRFADDDYAGYAFGTTPDPTPFVAPSGVFGAWSGSLGVETPQFRIWDASVRIAHAATAIFPEAARGRATSVQGGVTVRPTPKIRVFGTMTWTRLDRAIDGSEFGRAVIPRLKLEVQPTRSLFFRVVAEYRSERTDVLRGPNGELLLVGGVPIAASSDNGLQMDWLASYEPTPGTVAFFGYGSTLDAERTLSFRDLRRRQDGFFVKLAYLFRR